MRTSGARKASRFRKQAAGFIRTSVSSRRSAVSTWTSSLRRLCQRVCTSTSVAFDIGTGTGVLAAVLARRGIERVVATDLDPRALACARENVRQLGLIERIDVVQADLFPEGRAALVVCNPPWIPARPSSPMENGIYDPESRMLRGFLRALPEHLTPGGEGWLILSDLAEHLGLEDPRAVARRVRGCGIARPGPKRCAAATSASG